MSACTQTSTNTPKTQMDASTTTTVTEMCHSSTNTTKLLTRDISIQTSTTLASTPQKVSNTNTVAEQAPSIACQTTLPTSQHSSSQTSSPLPSAPTTTTGVQVSSTLPSTTQASLAATKKKKKKPKRNHQSSCLDAATSYDPPTTSYRHCRLCHDPAFFDDNFELSHLLTCHELPEHLQNYRDMFFQQQASSTGIPVDSLQTQTALFLTTHSVEDPDPEASHSLKDYLIGQLFLNAIDDFDHVEHYHGALSKFIMKFTTSILQHLHLDSKSNIDQIFYGPGIDHLLREENDEPTIPYDFLDLLDDNSFNDDDELTNEYINEEY